MIYSNKRLAVKEKELPTGIKVNVVTMGEKGRGRKEITLCVPHGVAALWEGENNVELTVGFTRTGKPRINKVKEGERKMFLLLDTQLGYTRIEDGELYLLKAPEKRVSVIAEGNSADGIAGRVGTAVAMVLEVHRNCWIKIIYGGGKTEYLYCCTDDMFVSRVAEDDMDIVADWMTELPADWESPEIWEKL